MKKIKIMIHIKISKLDNFISPSKREAAHTDKLFSRERNTFIISMSRPIGQPF
jgi:hypothetical protein